MTLTIQGTNLALTDVHRALVHEKMEDALRVLGRTDREPLRARIELAFRDHHLDAEADVRAFRAEVMLTGLGPTFRAEGAGDDAERAVVAMKHDLARQLRTWREKQRDAQRAGARRVKRGEV